MLKSQVLSLKTEFSKFRVHILDLYVHNLPSHNLLLDLDAHAWQSHNILLDLKIKIELWKFLAGAAGSGGTAVASGTTAATATSRQLWHLVGALVNRAQEASFC